MRKLLLDHDPVVKQKSRFYHDSEGEEFVIEDRVDVEDVVEQNKALYAQTDENARWGEFDRVASIPLVVYFDLKREGVLDDPVRLRRWLNDPENRLFRTRPGRV